MKFGAAVSENEERLAFLTKAPLERLTRFSQTRHYPEGTEICTGAELCDFVYLVLSGRCEVRASGKDGSQQPLAVYEPGMVFGGRSQVAAEEGRGKVVAVSETVLLRIERQDLETLRAEVIGRPPADDGVLSRPTSSDLAAMPDRRTERRGVVTLAFLSHRLPASLITSTLARWLCAETAASVVLVRLAAWDHRQAQATDFLNGEFNMPARFGQDAAGYHFLTLGIDREGPSATGIASLVDKLSRRFDYVLIETPAESRGQIWLFEFLRRSDSAYLFVGTAELDVAQVDLVAKGLKTLVGGPVPRLKPIACLPGGKVSEGFGLSAERAAGPVHMYVHGCPVRAGGEEAASSVGATAGFERDLRRVAREIGGRLVGLALSSGAAKGFSHIGVLQVLEENGIEVDVVAGASMGAYVGSLWAYGLEGRELERLARELEEPGALWSLVDPVFLPRQGFLRGLAVKNRLMRSLGHARFGDLVRPLRVVAGNLATLERVVFASGEVATAVHCSVAVPGICVPITIDGETYIDGAVVDPLPVDVLREMGVARVLAVDAIPTPDRVRYTVEIEREMARQKAGRARRFFRRAPLEYQPPSTPARGNLLQIVMRSLHGAQIRVAEASCREADLVLRPNIYDDRWADCARPGKFITLGREVAERHLDAIKQLVGRGELNHERKLASEPVAAVA